MSTLMEGLSDGSLAANLANAGTAAARTAAFSRITLRQPAPDSKRNATVVGMCTYFKCEWYSCEGFSFSAL